MGEKVKLKTKHKQTFKTKWKGRTKPSVQASATTERGNGHGGMQVPSLHTPYCHLCAVTAALKATAGFRAGTHEWNKQMQP